MAKKAKQTKQNAAPETKKEESKSERFSRIASLRGGKAIKALRVMRKLGGSRYEYEQAQIDKLCNALDAEVKGLRAALEGSGPSSDEGFSV